MTPPTKSLSERLREACQKGAEDIEPWQCNPYLFGEAADALDAKDAEIERLRRENKELRRDADALFAQVVEVADALNAKDALLAQAAAALEPLARNADAVSLGEALGHIERKHLHEAREALAAIRDAKS